MVVAAAAAPVEAAEPVLPAAAAPAVVAVCAAAAAAPLDVLAPVDVPVAADPAAEGRHFDPPIRVCTGGAPPSPTLLERMEKLGVKVTHLYGLTETYGPHTLCEMQTESDLHLLLGGVGQIVKTAVLVQGHVVAGRAQADLDAAGAQ